MRQCLASFAGVSLLGLILVGGCSDFRSLFSAHADVVADVGGQQLTAERLSKIMTASKGAQVSRDAADFVTQLWVDQALFAQAAATGTLPMDSASTAEAVWSDIAEARGRRWHDTLVARRPPVGPAQADSVYRANDVRLLQHILFRSAPSDPAAARTAARKKAEATLAQIRGGANFGGLAAKLSDDPGSRVDSGFLPPARKGQFVPTFDSAGWSLAPGAVSGVIESPFGFHIIKRPMADAVRNRLAKYVSQTAGMRLDSIYMDSLAKANKIEVGPGAPALMRAALNDPDGSRHSSKVIAMFVGGQLTVGEFVRWLQALPPQYSSQLKQVPDSMLQRFARLLTQNTLLIRAADSAGIRLTPTEWSQLAQRHSAQISTLRRELGLTGPELQDSTLSIAERKKRATLKVDQYFDDLTAGRRRLSMIPTAYAAMLRDRGPYRIYTTGVNRALELAKATQVADSAAGGGIPARPTGLLKRAPGPPPIPSAHGPASAPAVTTPAAASAAAHTPAAAAPADAKSHGQGDR